MSESVKNNIRKHAGVFWLIGIACITVLVYLVCSLIMDLLGVAPTIAGTVSIDVSAITAIAMYIVLAIWGVRNL